MTGRRESLPGRSSAGTVALKNVMVRDWLLERIATGEFASGHRLPSEHELMAQFGVSRVTVRQALDDLRKRGAVASRRGKGYFVNRLVLVNNLGRLQGFGEILSPLGVKVHSNIVELLYVPADRETASALKVEKGDAVVRIVRQRLAGENVISLDVSYFPLDVGRRLMWLDLGREDIFHLLETRLQLELGYADLLLEVQTISADKAPYLGVCRDAQVLRIQRITYDADGRPIDAEEIYSRLDAMSFRVRVPRW